MLNCGGFQVLNAYTPHVSFLYRNFFFPRTALFAKPAMPSVLHRTKRWPYCSRASEKATHTFARAVVSELKAIGPSIAPAIPEIRPGQRSVLSRLGGAASRSRNLARVLVVVCVGQHEAQGSTTDEGVRTSGATRRVHSVVQADDRVTRKASLWYVFWRILIGVSRSALMASSAARLTPLLSIVTVSGAPPL